MSRGGSGPEAPITGREKFGAAAFAVITTAVVVAIAWWLWTNGGDRGQGAAYALAGAAATHLMKETREILNQWFPK